MASIILCCLLASVAAATEQKAHRDGQMAAPQTTIMVLASTGPEPATRETAMAEAPKGSPSSLVSLSEDFRLEPINAASGHAVPLANISGETILAAQEAAAGGAGQPTRADSHEPYGTDVFFREAKSIPWRLAGATAVITATGIANWNWGSSPFRFRREGWFGKDTASLGMDKLGHAYSAYVLTDFFASGIEKASPAARRRPPYTAAILSMGLMTYIEVFDGFSKDHGFSYEDLAVDAAGALFAVARRSIPGLREKLDFRLLYKPSRSTIRALGCLPEPHCDRDGETVRSPITDYSGQRYLLALKLAGFPQLSQGPFRFLELHAGYYARGFTREEEIRGDSLRRRLFVGAGLNVGELLFGRRPRGLGGDLKSVLNYLQLPYTAAHSN